MRVITGMYRGRTINTVKDLSVRPATERVRQTIFNMLANRMEFEGARVLDLFAGSGSLGLEALSRGAVHATFVEQGSDAVEYIERNVRAFRCEERTEILEMDAMRYLDSTQGQFDLVFADPPYSFEPTALIPEIICDKGIVRPGGYLVVEHAGEVTLHTTSSYTAGPTKKFGRTIVTFFQPTTGRIPAP